MAFGRTNDYVETPAASVTPEEMEQTFYSALSRNTFIEGNITTKDDLVFSAGLKGNINSTKVPDTLMAKPNDIRPKNGLRYFISVLNRVTPLHTIYLFYYTTLLFLCQ